MISLFSVPIFNLVVQAPTYGRRVCSTLVVTGSLMPTPVHCAGARMCVTCCVYVLFMNAAFFRFALIPSVDVHLFCFRQGGHPFQFTPSLVSWFPLHVHLSTWSPFIGGVAFVRLFSDKHLFFSCTHYISLGCNLQAFFGHFFFSTPSLQNFKQGCGLFLAQLVHTPVSSCIFLNQ